MISIYFISRFNFSANLSFFFRSIFFFRLFCYHHLSFEIQIEELHLVHHRTPKENQKIRTLANEDLVKRYSLVHKKKGMSLIQFNIF